MSHHCCLSTTHSILPSSWGMVGWCFGCFQWLRRPCRPDRGIDSVNHRKATDEGIQVSILSMSGESFGVSVPKDTSIKFLKQAVAVQCGLEASDFQLTAGGIMLNDDMLVCKVTAGDILSSDSDATVSKTVSMYMVRHTTLERFEQRSLQEWREVAAELKNHEVDDEMALIRLRTFLDNYPELVNWQHYFTVDAKVAKPLLSFAVESVTSTKLRRQCVDELIQRGARVSIRHAKGYLVDRARDSGSAFVDYLEGKATEYMEYEKESIAAWRQVSAELCGECMERVQDEVQMTTIVKDFCTKYPELVNFQSNHAGNRSTGEPYGYFGYSPLIAFAGAQHCRRMSGQNLGDKTVRKGAVEELLKSGARVDMQHGGRTAIEWMQAEGSHLVEWLQAQLRAPAPLRAPFVFRRATLAVGDDMMLAGQAGATQHRCLQRAAIDPRPS